MSPLKTCQMHLHARSTDEYIEGSTALMETARTLMVQALNGVDHKARRIAYWHLFCINNTLGMPTETMEAMGIEAPRLEGGAA
ncbi:hypothetical protein [Hydrogenophaga electricum]|uniref:Uncharacterized protein n=1 Tax=Hydrogenophaga electricum TaxID=1230953 RepID=A0ABQ6BZL0_9BURK|nr:hypothetical protein [Hydrogenophaga electricum]GLS13578.1 hypothetical protein GCM10007935_10080 [Hydrogenophaga electricum]